MVYLEKNFTYYNKNCSLSIQLNTIADLRMHMG